MTRLAAFFVVLSLIAAPHTAWAQQRQTESAKKTRAVKASSKTKATKTKATPKRKPVKKGKKAAPAAESQQADTQQAPPATPSMQVEPAMPLSPTDDSPTVQKKSREAPAEGGDSLDFDLLEPAEAATAAQVDPDLERRIGRRRTMLKLHQGLGFAMAAGLVGTTVVGQLQFNDSFRGGGDDRNLLGLHRGLAIGTSALFATVGMLGVLAPEPFEKEKLQWDTITVHKMFMALATVGMVAQIILGIMATDRFGRLSETDMATAHQISGYVTLGAVSAGVFTLFF